MKTLEQIFKENNERLNKEFADLTEADIVQMVKDNKLEAYPIRKYTVSDFAHVDVLHPDLSSGYMLPALLSSGRIDWYILRILMAMSAEDKDCPFIIGRFGLQDPDETRAQRYIMSARHRVMVNHSQDGLYVHMKEKRGRGNHFYKFLDDSPQVELNYAVDIDEAQLKAVQEATTIKEFYDSVVTLFKGIETDL